MSTLSDELFKTAESLQAMGSQNSQAVALFVEAATQENALNALSALSSDAATAAQIQTITATVNAQTTRLAASIAHAQTVVSIAGNLVTIIGGAGNPLSVLPTLNTVLAQLSS